MSQTSLLLLNAAQRTTAVKGVKGYGFGSSIRVGVIGLFGFKHLSYN